MVVLHKPTGDPARSRVPTFPMNPTYQHKTKPFAHQHDELEASWELKSRALWWEQGTGKTKPILDTAARLFSSGRIRAVLVLAPKSVAPNWARDEVRRHLPDDVAARSVVVLWDSGKAGTARRQRELEAALRHDGLVLCCMSYDGIKTEVAPGAMKPSGYSGKYRKGREFARELLETRPTLMVLDEATRIKDPGTKLAKRVLAAGPMAAYRRVLTGTPIDNSPFDAYAQVQFLDPFFWARHGCRGWPAFKATYADWAKGLIAPDRCPHPREARPHCGCRTFPILVRYKNLPDLKEVLRDVGSRLLKEDVLDLPPKLHSARRFDMLPAQRELYDRVRTDFMATLSGGQLVTAPLVITQLVRLQQLTSGYVRTDDGELVRASEENPRADLLLEVLEDVPHKSIVWCKFREDFEVIAPRLRAAGIDHVEYHGGTSTTDREVARARFQEDPTCRVFLGNPACAGEGLTLHAAQTVVYFNNNFRLSQRLQSEDRAHRIGQEHPVHYVDLIADGTVDEKILDALRAKKDIADLILGDPQGGWL